MCGIIRYVGSRAAKEFLIPGPERLEFRGYDSAGIALLEDDCLDYVRAVGNLANLKLAVAENGCLAPTGPGHPRRGTQGIGSGENPPPLPGCDQGKLAIVLNGIVENYRELKAELQAGG